MSKRLFVAIEVPADLKSELGAKVREWHKFLPLKPFYPENLHLTVLFLGDVNEEDVSDIKACLREAAERFSDFELRIERIEPGPKLKNPRLMWALIPKAEKLLELKHGFADCLKRSVPRVRQNIDKKQFSGFAHLTLARFQKGASVPNKTLARISGNFKATLPVAELNLIESELTREGPVYTVLARVSLPG